MITDNSVKLKLSNALSACMLPLLDLLEWEGERRALVEAKPYITQEFDESGLMNTMANLGFVTEFTDGTIDKFDHRLIPCLFISTDGEPIVITGFSESGMLYFDGIDKKYKSDSHIKRNGRFYFFKKANSTELNPSTPQKRWFGNLITRFRSLIVMALGLSLILSFTALITPLTIIGVYKIIGSTNSINSLKVLGIGILIFLSADFGFRWFRVYLQNYSGARINNIVLNQVMRRILYLPPSMTEMASLGSQVARIRDFSSVRAFIEGAGFTSLLDLPFFIILFVVMFFISGELTYIPIIATVIMVVFGFSVMPWVKKINEEASIANIRKQEFLLEFLNNFGDIRFVGAMKMWKKRYVEISSDASIVLYHNSQINTLINTVSQGIVSLAGAATIGFGVLHVLNGSMNSAALLGAMILVWRILAPIKSGFTVISQSVRIKKSINQLDRLMQLKIEAGTDKSSGLGRTILGDIKFHNVSIRYNQESHPALLGINLDIKHGECIALTGHDGAGKSTMLKLILGMYKPQSGRVIVDNLNIQQLNPLLIRRSIAYAPQHNDLFYGTLEQNITLSRPTATEDEIYEAAKLAGLYDDIQRLPNKLNERVGDQLSNRISSSFTKKLILTRLFVQESRLVLMDEPEHDLDHAELDHITETLSKIRNDKTIILVTNSPQLMKMADRIITLDRGRIKNIQSNKTTVRSSGGNNEAS